MRVRGTAERARPVAGLRLVAALGALLLLTTACGSTVPLDVGQGAPGAGSASASAPAAAPDDVEFGGGAQPGGPVGGAPEAPSRASGGGATSGSAALGDRPEAGLPPAFIGVGLRVDWTVLCAGLILVVGAATCQNNRRSQIFSNRILPACQRRPIGCRSMRGVGSA